MLHSCYQSLANVVVLCYKLKIETFKGFARVAKALKML